ncbi:DVU_1555 family C-GCAxxG-C-C protein [Desulfoluna spongiiphila]|uniref:Putative redox-active protein (C_GCAxxG_C_C) n=1 Tax=Desulfoluna spongiiphila TaxID=419481 RepID=A0A1G5E240_9BACT|nr:DV_1555 family C-GCAxxG-C-C protein [Desulfoluna spongiiphila]SCY21062.1 Putative redox-active protein (C_GCAxxG_C_C) [Desulfoluna spongiiphila]
MNDLLFKLIELSSRGYCCSQILLLLGLENLDRENPDLVRAMAGPCMGRCGGVCGVLPGAACLLSLYCAKGQDHETAHEGMPFMLEELDDWFAEYTAEHHGGMQCEQIAGDTSAGPDMGKCRDIIMAAYAKVMEIMDIHGIDPAGEDHA